MSSPPPPATRLEPVTETLHGVAVTDPYRWLEGNNSDPQRMGQVTPAVTEWTDTQNAYTRAVLDTLPGRAALEERLSEPALRRDPRVVDGPRSRLDA